MNRLLSKLLIPLILFLLLLQPSVSQAAEIGISKGQNNSYSPYPFPDSGYITDNAEILSASQEDRLEDQLWQTEKDTGVEIAVVTVKSIKDYPGTDNLSIESFAYALFNKYKIGNLPKNNGVLLLVAIEDRKVRIELGQGYNMADSNIANKITQTVITPDFKKGNYAEGISDGVKSIVYEFAGLRVGIPWDYIWISAGILVACLVVFSLYNNGKRGWGWVIVGGIFMIILYIIRVIVILICSSNNSTRSRRPYYRDYYGTSGSFFGGSSSSGSFSGGFGGGFGGGSSGGGGATGSW